MRILTYKRGKKRIHMALVGVASQEWPMHRCKVKINNPYCTHKAEEYQFKTFVYASKFNLLNEEMMAISLDEYMTRYEAIKDGSK
jgi:hypothetical protein